ncbi:alpha/beta hydrolase [Planctomyces sp. SH-PL62]|uniref:alpha/beta hydrolase n=1 Tax=Planctomyces sp. SH-PL62 TaxID=1636152 RepID=UPI00078EB48A|nr:alpha/beta hydrolase [Planctomyces sp. SH-PL62]AMV38063.1 Carboxylesterase NlhH [Planctomyces sp. SH-PL62]
MFRSLGFAMLGLLVVRSAIAAGGDDDGGRKLRDVAYADAASTRLNVDAPAEGDRHPIVVWVHGGAWRFGDKDFVQEQPKAFTKRGYVWVGVGYRFVPEVTYKEQAGDVARAVRWARDHAKEFGGDPDRIFLMGHSAGAHLAALTATDERYLKAAGLDLDALSGVILLDGAGYDVPRQIRESVLPRIRSLYTGVFGDDPKVQEDASPIQHVAGDKGIAPFLILHVGRLDSRTQSNALAARLREAGVEATVAAFPSKTHMTINRELGRPGDRPTQVVFDFLEARCNPEPAAARAE